MAPGIPRDPEGGRHIENYLAAEIWEEVTGSWEQETPEFLCRTPLMDPLVFDETIDTDIRWQVIENEQKSVEAVLNDTRLDSVLTNIDAPRTAIWRRPEGQLVETTLIRFDEQFSLAQEVTMDELGRPLSMVVALWQGDHGTVTDFLEEHPVDPGEEELLPELPEMPSNRRNRILTLAALADTALHYFYSEIERMTELIRDGVISAPSSPPPPKRINVTKPAPGKVHNGFVPPVVKQGPMPTRRRLSSQSGARWGKRGSR